MLGTREPVTPCLVAQNPPRLPPLEAALGCAWKQASPIISYKILERAPKLARKRMSAKQMQMRTSLFASAVDSA